MQKLIPVVPLTVLGLLVLALLLSQSSSGAAQGTVGLGADTDPDGNTATSLGPHERCISVNTGDTFDFDIFVSDVVDLVHWELYLRFDPSIIEVDNADMHLFLEDNQLSSLKVEWIPYSGGRHFLGAADLRGAPESGSGVLARLTLQAKAPGFSSADFLYDDVDNDGDIDIGPRLTASDGAAIGDVTGDGVFDGPTYHARIAVDESCDAETPTPTLPPSPTPQAGGDTPPSDTSPPPDILPVPGDPTLEPPSDTSPSADDGQDSAAEGEGEEDTTDSDTNGDDDSEEGSGAAVLRRDGTPSISDGDGGSRALGGDSSSGGGLPLWAIGFIAATVLVSAAGASVLLAARAGGRFGR